jgi:hypothetical protein
MQDLYTILLLYTLRVALVSLEQSPDLDRDYPGIRDLTSSLKQQIGKIESRAHLVHDGWLRPDSATARKAQVKRNLTPKPPVTARAKASLASIRDSKSS